MAGDTVRGFTKEQMKQLGSVLNPTDETVLISPLERLAAQSKLFNKTRKDLVASGLSDHIQDLGSAFNEAAQESLRLFGNVDRGQESLNAFRKNAKAFIFMNKDFRDSMLRTATAMQGLGFEADTLAEIVDSSMYAFQSSSKEMKSLMAEFTSMSRNLAIPGETLAQNFRTAQRDFAYTAGRFKENFKELQVFSRDTGISFDSLTGTFGSSFDTFQGAAEKAGQLNQILGRSAFNSIELLNMTEAERAKRIKSEFKGRDASQMKKFELMAIKNSLGFGTIEETRKFLRSGSPGGEGSIDTDKEKEFNKKMATTTDNLSSELKHLENSIKRNREPIENALVELGNTLASKARQLNLSGVAVKKILTASGINADKADDAEKAIAKLNTIQRTEVVKLLALAQGNSQKVTAIIDNIDSSSAYGIKRDKVDLSGMLPNIKNTISSAKTAKDIAAIGIGLMAIQKAAGVISKLSGIDQGLVTLAALETVAGKIGNANQRFKELDNSIDSASTTWSKMAAFFKLVAGKSDPKLVELIEKKVPEVAAPGKKGPGG